MILKSDTNGRAMEMPVDMASAKPHVSLLEFLSVELPRRGGDQGSGSGLGEAAHVATEAVADDAAASARTASQEEMRSQERAMQTRAMVEAARAESRAATRREMEQEIEERMSYERARVAAVCAEFNRDRQRYFADAEEQVVKLALAIAARVLHREATMDPLLLAGAVRVAIAKLEEGSAISLRVVPADVALWREVFPTDSEPAVEVCGDERLSAGEVVLETVVGRVELGVAVQLEEIEQGFFDLLQRRPS
jgi:flagellar assembly protein FliH